MYNQTVQNCMKPTMENGKRRHFSFTFFINVILNSDRLIRESDPVLSLQQPVLLQTLILRLRKIQLLKCSDTKKKSGNEEMST